MIKNIIFSFFSKKNYIKNHLTHLKFNLLKFKLLDSLNNNKYSFWNLNLDSFIVSIILLFLIILYIFYSLKNIKNNKVPSKLSIFLDVVILFVYYNVKEISKKKNKNIFSLAFSVFTWIFLVNIVSIFPIDILPYLIKKIFKWKYFLISPSADINFTFSISFTVLIYILIYKLINLGFKKIFYNFIYHPFNNSYLIFANILLQSIDIIAKLLSLSLRLFGNMYSGEIIFILIYFVVPLWLQWMFAIPLMFFHLLVSFLQSFIFMILTLIYIC